MESVDKTIDAICDWIQNELKQIGSVEELMTLPEMTKSLAMLVEARERSY